MCIRDSIASEPGYAEACVKALAEITGWPVKLSADLVGATSDTSVMSGYSSALRRIAVKINKICNDIRLLSSGPRAGIGEFNVPAVQPGSSIMPGKVNPVIPEVMSQVCYKVCLLYTSLGRWIKVTLGHLKEVVAVIPALEQDAQDAIVAPSRRSAQTLCHLVL